MHRHDLYVDRWVVAALVIALMSVFVAPLSSGEAQSPVPDLWRTEDLLGATDQELEEGYFAVGTWLMLMTKPRGELHEWLRARKGKRVRVTIEVVNEPTSIEE